MCWSLFQQTPLKSDWLAGSAELAGGSVETGHKNRYLKLDFRIHYFIIIIIELLKKNVILKSFCILEYNAKCYFSIVYH